jgi:hypothetical protein
VKVTQQPKRHRCRAAAVAAAIVLAVASPAMAQLDPLLFLKRVPPTVVIVVDTSFRMLDDGTGDYYDPSTYTVASDPTMAAALGVGSATTYRRVYRNLQFETVQGASSKYYADSILAVPDTAAGYATFWNATRMEIAKKGIATAVGLNVGARYRWGLMKLRQTNPAWTTSPDCDTPVRVTGTPPAPGVSDVSPCNAGAGKLGIYAPKVTGANSAAASATALVTAPAANTGTTIVSAVSPMLPMLNTVLIPAGQESATEEDRPLANALTDAKAQIVAAMGADATGACRNSVVVLIAGGKDYSVTDATVAAKATEFLSVTGGGVTRRVPIYVVGVKPKAADVAQLQSIATKSGGRYYSVSTADDVARVINLAAQAGFSSCTDFDAGRSTEFVPVSPLVGTVDLANAKGADGTTLPATVIQMPTGEHIPQRNNVIITAGFALGGPLSETTAGSPGFDGRLRAFRAFKPVADSTTPAGYRFDKDGTPLWPDVDGRPTLAGLARVPSDPGRRNIYTCTATGTIVPFTVANASTLAPYLGGADPTVLIPFIRNLPLGAIVGSTPAVMDPPSLEPPPDADYGRPEGTGTYAGDHTKRRAIIWVGTNDGMLHAIDARTGFEVWAFIPFNLLPKLHVLLHGQPVEQFEYFVEASPKIGEIKMNGEWKTLLLIGEGPGGTFYQAFDVTEAGMGGPDPDSDDVSGVLTSFESPTRVGFLWSFPRYSSFDPTVRYVFNVSDATSGGKVKLYGDLKSAATNAEKSVGFTWSTPAVGAIKADRSVNAAIVGSGYFPAVESLIPARTGTAAGRSLYLINLEDGKLIGNTSGSSCSGTGCIDVGDVSSNSRKNALQADPSVTGDPNSYVAKRAYLGDIDGNYWRFDFTSSGAITKKSLINTSQPIYGSSALLLLGNVDQYVFFATGSDLLPTTPASAGGTGTFKMYAVRDENGTGKQQFAISLASVTDTSGVATGERPSGSPSVAGDIVFFTTTTQSAATPCDDFSSSLYALTYAGTQAYAVAGGDSSGDSKKPKDGGSGSTTPTAVATTAGRATSPFVVDQHLYFGTLGKTGGKLESFGNPSDYNNGVGQVGVRILSWREIKQ